MEKKDDVQLIRKILSDDDKAFNTLVQKYQNSVHAFAWRKVGDFHLGANSIGRESVYRQIKNSWFRT